MSRCFPFPPPGYEKKTRSDHADLLAEEKRKEKKHKKEKRDKEKREGKEKRDKDRSKDKHKEKKDRKEKHKDKKKKDKDKEKSKILHDRADKRTQSPHGGILGECSQKTEEVRHSKFTEELDRRIKDEEKVAADRKIENFSGPIQRSMGSSGSATGMVKERAAGDKIIASPMGAPQRRIDGLERPADKFTVSTQRNEGLFSANAVQNERNASDKVAPKLISTGQRGNGGTALPVENQMGSVQRRSEGPYPATTMEIDNYKNNKVASNSNSAVQRTTNGMGRPAQSLSIHKNVDSVGLVNKMDKGDFNKIIPNHVLMEQRRNNGMGRSVEKDANNRIEDGKEKNREREAGARKEERHKDRDHDQKKIKDKDKHKGKEKEKAKVKEKDEEKQKEQNKPRDGRKKDLSGRLNLKPLAPRTDNANNYLVHDNIKKRKEIDINGFLNENNMQPNKLLRTNPSSFLCGENGTTVESSHIALAFPSVKSEAINDMLAGKRIDSKEHMTNGITEAQPSSAGLMHPVATKTGATSKVSTNAHPDSKYLNQIYSIPKGDEWPEYDDQEWLFSSCYLLQKPKSKLEGDQVPQVWSEALRIETEDVVALPYVVPF